MVFQNQILTPSYSDLKYILISISQAILNFPQSWFQEKILELYRIFGL